MTRLYRALLRLYPASFRHDYGDEMAAVFADAWAASSPLGRVVLVLSTVASETVDAFGVHWALLVQDLRYTGRTLNRARGFALAAILVTALGVGANTAAFSVADFVLVRPLPFADPEALVQLCEGPRDGGGWGCMNQLSPANYRDLKAMSGSFEALGAFAGEAANLVGAGEPRRVNLAPVTPDVLPLLGVAPALGRGFAATGHADDRAVILSHGLWQSAFGGDRGVLGRAVTLNGASYTVIGVMPPAFQFPHREVQMWTALTFAQDDYADRDNSYIAGVGRLRPGVTFEQARAELTSLAARLSAAYPDTNAETGISFFRMRDNMAPRFWLILVALSGASLCLLLLTCANVANLLLARATARGREFAVRAALGAGRERLVRQLITESVALSVLGGAAGVFVARLAIPLFSSLVPATLPIEVQPTVDWRVLALAAAITCVTGLAFGLIPAFGAGGRTGFNALREGPRSGGGAKQRLRSLLVTVEITISVVLLITSGLLLRAVWRVQAVDPGFRTGGVLTLKTELPTPKYDDPVRRGQFYERVLTEVRALPGVGSAAFVTGLPIAMIGGITQIEIPGRDLRDKWNGGVSHRFVTPQFFRTLRIPLLRGRDVEDADTATRAWVAVVSQSFAERHWPGQDSIGKTFRHRGHDRTIVGVVGDVKFRGLERTSEPQIYLPAAQFPTDTLASFYAPKDLVVRYAGDPGSLMPALRQIVHAADAEQPISDVRTLDDLVAGETAPRRAQLRVLGALALIALLLSGVGIHGLLAYTVAQRSQEIGVRLALGATASGVARMIVLDGLRLAALGILVGVPAGYAAARAMSALLFGLEPGDPVTMAGATGLALVMTLAGSLSPALRALRVSPLMAMRVD
jgi:putative ABC transport system permease protein